MNSDRILEILDSYRPGEGLEEDPEVRQALERATTDAELAERRHQGQLFDEAFGAKLRAVEAPESLRSAILLSHRSRTASPAQPPAAGRPRILQWIHPSAFAAAAAIILFLALSFTFLDRPAPSLQTQMQVAGALPLMETAKALRANLNPSFRSRDSTELIAYLQDQGASLPGSMPKGFAWISAFACDVMQVDGRSVSLICFTCPESNEKFHLFTFRRSDFSNEALPSQPQMANDGQSCCATWADEEQVHVLYAEGGENNLRQLLDI